MLAHDAIISGTARPRRAAGFTLVELLIVIAIIALLAAILFPVFAAAREKARSATCQSNLKQIALGFHQYSQDNDERLPHASDFGPTNQDSVCTTYTDEPVIWPAKVYPYINNRQVFKCPSMDKAINVCGSAYPAGYNYGWNTPHVLINRPAGGAYYCGGATYSSYGYNAYYLGGAQYMGRVGLCLTAASVSGTNIVFNEGAALASVAYPASTVLVADNSYFATAVSPPAFIDAPWVFNAADTGGDNWCSAQGGSEGYDSVPKRHGEGLNVAFLDGHVKWLKKEVLMHRPDFKSSGAISCSTWYNNTDPDFLWNRY